MIPKEFKKTNEILNGYDKAIVERFGDNEPLTFNQEIIADYMENPKTLNPWTYDIAASFDKEYRILNETNTYFLGCLFSVYTSHYQDRLNTYLSNNPDAQEINFIEQELKSIIKFYPLDYLTSETIKNIHFSLSRQMLFLEDRLFLLGFSAEYDSDYAHDNHKSFIVKINRLNQNQTTNSVEEEEVLRATEKLIYLDQLGVLDFLKNKTPFSNSTNLLAEVLGRIINEKTTTLQPYLNEMFNPNGIFNKDPRNNNKAVTKVSTYLSGIGFKSNTN